MEFKVTRSTDLMHSGIKGMKWGERRYQNKDGSLTELGRKRYGRDAREKEYNKYDSDTGKYYKESKKNGRSDLEVDASRYVKEDMSRSKRLTDETTSLTRNLKTLNDSGMRNKPKNTMNLSKMSDREMRDQINRALLEKQYNDIFAPQTVSKGREQTSKILETAGSVLAVTSSALGIALAIKELRG